MWRLGPGPVTCTCWDGEACRIRATSLGVAILALVPSSPGSGAPTVLVRLPDTEM